MGKEFELGISEKVYWLGLGTIVWYLPWKHDPFSLCPDNLGLSASQESFLVIIIWAGAWNSTLLGCKSVP